VVSLPSSCFLETGLPAASYAKVVVRFIPMLGVYAFRDLEQDERFNELEIEKVFRVIVGERKDKAFVVYAKLQNPEEEESVLARITMYLSPYPHPNQLLFGWFCYSPGLYFHPKS